MKTVITVLRSAKAICEPLIRSGVLTPGPRKIEGFLGGFGGHYQDVAREPKSFSPWHLTTFCVNVGQVSRTRRKTTDIRIPGIIKDTDSMLSATGPPLDSRYLQELLAGLSNKTLGDYTG